MPTLQAIPTNYLGRAFRSRLEARWAAFFYALNVRFDYEPEAYSLPSGNYLPDFYIPKQPAFPDPIWFEVKPPGSMESLDRFDELLLLTHTRGAVLRSIPDREWEMNVDEEWWVYVPIRNASGEWGLGSDSCFRFCDCPVCSAIGFEFLGRAERISSCGHLPHKTYRDWTPRLKRAYALALSMRFDGLEGL